MSSISEKITKLRIFLKSQNEPDEAKLQISIRNISESQELPVETSLEKNSFDEFSIDNPALVGNDQIVATLFNCFNYCFANAPDYTSVCEQLNSVYDLPEIDTRVKLSKKEFKKLRKYGASKEVILEALMEGSERARKAIGVLKEKREEEKAVEKAMKRAMKERAGEVDVLEKTQHEVEHIQEEIEIIQKEVSKLDRAILKKEMKPIEDELNEIKHELEVLHHDLEHVETEHDLETLDLETSEVDIASIEKDIAEVEAQAELKKIEKKESKRLQKEKKKERKREKKRQEELKLQHVLAFAEERLKNPNKEFPNPGVDMELEGETEDGSPSTLIVNLSTSNPVLGGNTVFDKQERIDQVDNWLQNSSRSLSVFASCGTLVDRLKCYGDDKCEPLIEASNNQYQAERCYKAYRDALSNCSRTDTECLIAYHNLHAQCYQYSQAAFDIVSNLD